MVTQISSAKQFKGNIFLNQIWQKEHLDKIAKKANTRYTPELNVELAITALFDSMSRTKSFYTDIRKHFGKLNRNFERLSDRYEDEEAKALYLKLKLTMKSLFGLIANIKEFSTVKIPWRSIKIASRKAKDIAFKLSLHLEIIQEKSNKNSYSEEDRRFSALISGYIHYISELQNELYYFENTSSEISRLLSNKPFLVLTGDAGVGKTHLLCDLVRLRTNCQLPSVLVFGEDFKNNIDPWQIFLSQTKIKNKESFLKQLDQAGKKSQVRSLLIIDALNETQPSKYWRRHLKILCDELSRYPHIALVVTVRSGFEDEVLSSTSRKKFIQYEHYGFKFQQWEAVSKFFTEHGLPLPEIPLLLPEFQNPLFLLLFCKAFEKRTKENNKKPQKRQVFKGHEGATYIFEHFVKKVSDKIASRLGIKGGRNSSGEYFIWDTIIKKLAEAMVFQNSDRLTEELVLNIIKQSYPSIDTPEFVGELEKNLLIVKTPRYAVKEYKIEGFDYRFPYQRFSDHLLGRYIFQKYKDSGKKPKQFFALNTSMGKFISNDGWTRGVVRALCVQCPEHLNGTELFEVAPYLIEVPYFEQAFLESIIWRNAKAFTKDHKTTLWYINQYVANNSFLEYDLLNVFLAVATIPEHPFNADFLHSHLIKFKMAKRDVFWSTFLHYQYNQKTEADRYIAWSQSVHDKSHISNESLRLCCTVLVWFLTTPNRFLRDKATKALVALLTNRTPVILALLKQFAKIDDLYLLERLYAVAYGCVLRNVEDKDSIGALAEWVYHNIFRNGMPPAHILLRDYARGVIEVAQREKLINIEPDAIAPPYKSKWKNNTPSLVLLREKYCPSESGVYDVKNRGYMDIWSSVMYSDNNTADFGNYILGNAISHWSYRRIHEEDHNKDLVFAKFKDNLLPNQRNLLDKCFDFSNINISMMKDNDISDEKFNKIRLKQKQIRQEGLTNFKANIPKRKKIFFEKHIQSFLDEYGRIQDPREYFNNGLAQRWIFNRVVELGWQPDLHDEFDGNISKSSKSTRKAERIGKKYQWIALHELLARMADNFEFKRNNYSNETGKYEGPWQIHVRDIDPSFVPLKNAGMAKVGISQSVTSKLKYDVSMHTVPDIEWVKSARSLPNPKLLIDINESAKNNWLILGGILDWEQTVPPENEKYDIPRRTIQFSFNSYLVKEEYFKEIFCWAQQNFREEYSPIFFKEFFGEFAWAPAFKYLDTPYFHRNGWMDCLSNKQSSATVLLTTDQYTCLADDCSVEERTNIMLPAGWLVNTMKLSHKHADGRFFDEQGNLVAFDPSVLDGSIPSLLLCKKDKLVAFLRQKRYSIFWTLRGDKRMMGGKSSEQLREKLAINGTYALDDELNIFGNKRCEVTKF